MSRNILKHGWYVMENELKERWPAITQSDIDFIFGDHEKLVAVVQKRGHVSAEIARQDVDDFLAHLKLRATVG